MTALYLLLAPLLLLLLAASSVNGFSSVALTTSRKQTTVTRLFSSTSNDQHESSQQQYPPQFQRAVECAKTQGLCNVDELLELAEELEKYEDSCLWEVPMAVNGAAQGAVEADATAEECETEFLDRLDIADLLRAESEIVQRRENALEFKNVFREKVEQQQQQLKDEAHSSDDTASEEEAPPKQVIDLYSNYYECVHSKTGCVP